jgi:hypothetical protein
MYAVYCHRAYFTLIGLKIPRGSTLRVGSSPTSGTSFSKSWQALANLLPKLCPRHCPAIVPPSLLYLTASEQPLVNLPRAPGPGTFPDGAPVLVVFGPPNLPMLI